MLEWGKGGFSLDLEGFWEPVLPSLQFRLRLSDERVCLFDKPGHLVDGTGLVQVVSDNIRRDLGQLHVRPQTRGRGQAAVPCQCMRAWERGGGRRTNTLAASVSTWSSRRRDSMAVAPSESSPICGMSAPAWSAHGRLLTDPDCKASKRPSAGPAAVGCPG